MNHHNPNPFLFLSLLWCVAAVAAKFLKQPKQPPDLRKKDLARVCKVVLYGILFILIGGNLLAADTRAGASPWWVLPGLAVVPIPLHFALIFWLVRMEPEPPRVLWRTFFAGAGILLALALVLEPLAYGAAYPFVKGLFRPSLFKIAVIAPVIEESLKGLVLFLILRRYPDDFDDVTDGIIYAMAVGLGFAMTENLFFYCKAWASGGLRAAEALFVLRGFWGAYSHPMFTAMTGIGLGVAAQTTSKPVRFCAPAAGLAAAIFFHGLWNYSGSNSNDLTQWARIYVGVMAPLLALVFIVLWVALRKEEQFLCQHLEPDLKNGLLTRPEYDVICRGSARWRAFVGRLLRFQFKMWQLERRLELSAKELAFHRCRVTRQGNADDPAERAREEQYMSAVRDLSLSLATVRSASRAA